MTFQSYFLTWSMILRMLRVNDSFAACFKFLCKTPLSVVLLKIKPLKGSFKVTSIDCTVQMYPYWVFFPS